MGIEEKVIDIVKDVLGMENEKVTSEDTFDDLYADKSSFSVPIVLTPF